MSPSPDRTQYEPAQDGLRILHVTPSFYPATFFGGPIVSTYALCNALARQPGVELKVLTSDAAGHKPSQRLKVDGFPMIYQGSYEVFFTRRVFGKEVAPGLVARLIPMVRWADVVLLTGTYSLPTLPALAAAGLWRRPVMWSPRGALLASANWNGASNQRFKRLWEKACSAVMPRETLLHVTSEEERRASIARLPKADAVVIANGIDIPTAPLQREWMPDGVLRAMFIGRLNPVKAIDRLIEAVARAAPAQVSLDIYGKGEERYVEGLQRLARDLGVDGRVTFHGHVDGEAKGNAFASSDVCVLPSHSENFGMAIAEALAHGIPVIASRGIPWEGVETRGCGLWVENSPEGLADALVRLGGSDLEAMGKSGRAWMVEQFDWNNLAARTLEVMRGLGGRQRMAA